MATASVIPCFYHSVQWLSAIAVIMIVVQVLDAAIGIKLRDSLKTYGPAITAIFNLGALIWLIK